MKVKIAGFSGSAVVVEWYEQTTTEVVYYRTLLPSSVVKGRAGEFVELEGAEEGIPYGEPWEALLLVNGVAQPAAFRIANELHRLGIWTLAEYQARPSDALAAFQKGFGMDVQRLRQVAQARQQTPAFSIQNTEGVLP